MGETVIMAAQSQGMRQVHHRAGPSYRGETAFSPNVVPHLAQPFSVASQGSSVPPPYPDLGGPVATSTIDFTPGLVLAKVALSVLPGLKTYLAQRGDINVQLDESELDILFHEIG